MTGRADPARCPLCQESNDCRLGAGMSVCWCFDTPVSPAVLARVPLALRDVVCVCRHCATGRPTVERMERALRWTRR